MSDQFGVQELEACFVYRRVWFLGDSIPPTFGQSGVTDGRPVSVGLPATGTCYPTPLPACLPACLPVSLKTAAVLFRLGSAALDVPRRLSMLRAIRLHWALSAAAAAAAAAAGGCWESRGESLLD